MNKCKDRLPTLEEMVHADMRKYKSSETLLCDIYKNKVSEKEKRNFWNEKLSA